MRALWALYTLEIRRFWFVPVLAGVTSLASAAAYPNAGRVVGPFVGLAIGVMLLAMLGRRAADDQARFVFSRPVPTWAIASAVCLAVVTLAALVWAAAAGPIVFVLWGGPIPARFFLGQGSLQVVVAALALLAGGVLASVRAGVREALLWPLGLVGIIGLYLWILPRGDRLQAIPYAALEPATWTYWSWVGLVAATGLGALVHGVARGRGQSRPTISTTWRTVFACTAVYLVAWSAWLVHQRAATAIDITRVRRVHASDADQWALVTGDLGFESLSPPSFVVRVAGGASTRVPGLTFGQPTAFSRDGRVMAAVLLGYSRTARTAPVVIADLAETARLRPPRDIPLDDLSFVRIALSPSGQRFAVQTIRGLSVFDSSTGTRLAHVVQAVGYDALLNFRDEGHVISERVVGGEGQDRDVEIITLDAVGNTVAVLGRYRRGPNGTSTLDRTGRFVAVVTRAAGATHVDRFDLTEPAAAPRRWSVERANAIAGSPLALPDGRVVTLGWGSRYGTSTLRVFGGRDEVASLALEERWANGVQWLEGDLIALGRGRPDQGDAATLIVDIGTMTARRRVDGLVPARLFTLERPVASSPSTLFVEHGRRVVSRRDLLNEQ